MVKAATRVRKKDQEKRGGGHRARTCVFNNTIITITDRQGNALSWATSGGAGFRGFAEEHSLRRPGCRGAGGQVGSGIRCKKSGGSYQGAGSRARIRSAGINACRF